MSDRAITEDLLKRLQRHYIKPGDDLAGGMFLPEVTLAGRRADALYVGFFQSRGKYLVGHEIKAYRADWLRELDHPEKAEVWAPHCHAWYIVAAPGVVQEAELPHGWGLMLPGRSTTRMDVKVKAALNPDATPSWEATHAIVQRADSLRIQAIHEGKQKARTAIYAEMEQVIEQRMALVDGRADAARAEKLERLIRELEELTGIRVVDGKWSSGKSITLDDLRASLGPWTAAHRDATKAAGFLRQRFLGVTRDIDSAVKALNELERGVE